MKKHLLGFIVLFVFSTIVQSQQPISLTSSEIFLQIKKLKVLGSVLYVGAHPDDENNTLLPYLAKEKLYRTAYLSLTRGEGGQNLIGSELGIDLGLIRTQELLAARRQDGCEQYFTRAYEFGYSKSMEETLEIWDKEKILEDVVWTIRKFQPDIIIARFPPDSRAGHGHHAASALIANEAFVIAADSTKFIQQFQYGVKPHQAKRIVWNTFNFGGNNTTSDNQLKLDVNVYNNLLGKSYGEIGGEARTMHKSQGEGRPRRRGVINEYFSYTNGEKFKNDLMDGVDLNWNKLSNNNGIDESIEKLIANFNFEKIEASLPELIKLYSSIKSLPTSNWKEKKLNEVKDIIEYCSGVFIEATTNQDYVVQGDSIKTSFFIANRKNVNAIVKEIHFETLDSVLNLNLQGNQNFIFSKTFLVSNNKPLTQPYWLEEPMENGMFVVKNQQQIGEAESVPAYTVDYVVEIEGEKFNFTKPVLYKHVDLVRGELYQPIQIFPKLTIEVDDPIKMIINENAVKSNIKYTSYINNINIGLNNENSKLISYDKKNIEFKTENSLVEGNAIINNTSEKIYDIKAVDANTNKVFNQTLHQIKYDHIPTLTYFTNATIETKKVKVKTVGKKIGYIIGAGDKVPEALAQLGYEVDVLNEKDISLERLKTYQAIVTGIRAYNIHDWLSTKNEIVNQYISQGGNLLIQYLRNDNVNGKKIKAGPYYFNPNARSRVTEEKAIVNLILPDHIVFNAPNKIAQSDFENWNQERSTYQIDKSDSSFVFPISMNDKNEQASNGSLAIAKYGKGNVVYLSLTMFRQLPAGVSGAYRLMANIIALPKNK